MHIVAVIHTVTVVVFKQQDTYKKIRLYNKHDKTNRVQEYLFENKSKENSKCNLYNQFPNSRTKNRVQFRTHALTTDQNAT